MEGNCEKYKINQGDIIRFGRITTRIKEIKISKNINLDKSIEYSNNINTCNNNTINDDEKYGEIIKKKTNEPKIITPNDNKKVQLLKSMTKTIEKLNINKKIQTNIFRSTEKINRIKKICRICYVEEEPVSDFNNPLVQPCKCSGSLKYIHLNCLKHWLNTKSCIKVETNDNYSIFLVKPVECEICKTKFPDFVKHKENLYEILDFKSEFDNYFTIESLTIDKNNNRCIYVVNLDKNIKLKIGRGHDANLTLTDISVSRVHSIITIENKNIYLEDNNSKFGTLILVQSPTIKIIQNLPLYIQIGRTFMNCIIMQKTKNLFSCCEVHEKPNYNFYFQQNEKQKQVNLLNMFTVKSEIDYSEDNENDEKDFDKIKIEEKTNIINNRYDENTIDNDNINNTSKDENQNRIKILNKKSLFKNEENKNDYENEKEKSNNLANKSESIILESESEIIK
jgi:pSer/pThr/pTyr-binding forkhead associated (FHA) protein